MILEEQIASLIFAFIYGIIINILFNLFKKYLYNTKYICIFNNLLFFCDASLIYFIIMYKINGGIIHIYFILTTFASFLISNKQFYKKNVKK